MPKYCVSLHAHAWRARSSVMRSTVKQKRILQPFVRVRSALNDADAMATLDTLRAQLKTHYNAQRHNLIVMR